MASCIFCEIIAGRSPSRKVYEDNMVLAFLDINPLADFHTLVIPKR
jgi:histidine triad (HIT) family protein